MGIELLVKNNFAPLFKGFNTDAATKELEHTFRRRAKDLNFWINRYLSITAPTKAEIERDVELHSEKKGFIIRPAAMEKARTMWNAKSKAGKLSRVVPLATSQEITRLDNQISQLTNELHNLSAESKEYTRKIKKLDAQKRRLRTYQMRASVKEPLFKEYKMLIEKRTEVRDNFLNKQMKMQTIKRMRTRLKISATGIYPTASKKDNTTITGKLVTLHDLAVECEKQARLGAVRGTLKLFHIVEKQLDHGSMEGQWTQTSHPSTRGDTGYEYKVTDRGYVCSFVSPAFGPDTGSVQHVSEDRWETRQNREAIEAGFEESEKELVERVTESLYKIINNNE